MEDRLTRQQDVKYRQVVKVIDPAADVFRREGKRTTRPGIDSQSHVSLYHATSATSPSVFIPVQLL